MDAKNYAALVVKLSKLKDDCYTSEAGDLAIILRQLIGIIEGFLYIEHSKCLDK